MARYLDTNGLQDYSEQLTAKYKTIFATKGEVGSPLVAATAAAMTDTDKVYVYVGSEDGYTSGNWYYYNGSAWTSGGVYNSTAFETDPTLSVEGMAADAKATGEAIDDAEAKTEAVETAVDELFGYSSFFDLSTAPTTTNTITANGQWTQQSTVNKSCTIPIGLAKKIRVTAGEYQAIIAFLSTDERTIGQRADFSDGFNDRVVIDAGASQEFVVYGNMDYFYALLKDTSSHDRTPTVQMFYLTDPTLTEEYVPADAKATGDSIKCVRDITTSAKPLGESFWQRKGITASAGSITNSTIRISTIDYINPYYKSIYPLDGFEFGIYAWDNSGSYVGFWNGSEWATSGAVYFRSEVLLTNLTGDYNIRILARKVNNTQEIVLSESNNFIFVASYAEKLVGGTLLANSASDRTHDIETALKMDGVCRLGAGVFPVRGIQMPDNSTIIGCGDATKIRLVDEVTGSAVKLGDNCTVSDVTILGADESISLNGKVIGVTSLEDATVSGTNLWEEGNIDVTGATGTKTMLLTNPIPAGVYKITATVTSTDTNSQHSTFIFSNNPSTSWGSSSYINTVSFTRTANETKYLTLTETAYSVRFLSSNTVANSEGDTSSWSGIDIELTDVGWRHGISWAGDTFTHSSIINNCRIHHMDGSGIYAHDTGTPVYRGLIVSDCVISNANIGVYLRRDTEYNIVSNCVLEHNYYGVVNRGGNNKFNTCGVDSCKVGFLIDDTEGGNNGHGSIANCTINHVNSGNGYGLFIRGTGRMLVSNCNFYYSKTRLESTSGNAITGCGYGNTSGIEIVDGTCSIFNGCFFIGSGSDHTPVTITNNDVAQFVNCYTRAGAVFNPRA